MPPEKGPRLHHDEELSPVNHPRGQDKCDTGRIVQAPGLDLAFDIEGQLLAQEDVSAASRSREQQTSATNCSRSPTRRSAVRIIGAVNNTGRRETALHDFMHAATPVDVL